MPPPPDPIMSATRWIDNAAMVLGLRQLGYIKQEDSILDPTYQDGTWWRRWWDLPPGLITNSLDLANGADMCFDFRQAPFPDDTFDVITYDPPYVSKGGRSTATGEMRDHQRRYGIDVAPGNARDLQDLMDEGLKEMTRITKWNGIIFAKCQDYVTSGHVWWGSDLTRECAINSCGLKPIDKLYFLNNGSVQDPNRTKICPDCKGVGGPGRNQPIYATGGPCPTCDGSGRVLSTQKQARGNVSVLWVFQKVAA